MDFNDTQEEAKFRKKPLNGSKQISRNLTVKDQPLTNLQNLLQNLAKHLWTRVSLSN